MDSSNNISICVTAYNEANNIPSLVERLSSLINLHPKINEVVIVDNGSRDDTLKKLSEFELGCELQILHIPKNLGYGNGMKTSIASARNQIVCLLHADDQYSAGDISVILESYSKYDDQCLMIKGARNNRKDPAQIKMLSFFNSKLVSVLSGTKVRDANGIPKVFDKTKLHFPLGNLPNNAAMDGALCISWAKSGGKFLEIPVEYENRTIGIASWNSGKIRIAVSMLFEILKYRLGLRGIGKNV